MISEHTLFLIKNKINTYPELRGCRIGFHGNMRSMVLDNGNPSSPNYNKIIILEEVNEDLSLTNIPTTETVKLPHSEKTLNRTVAGSELIGAGLSCGFTVVSGIGVLGSAAAEVPTAGMSTVVLVAAWTGFVTQGIQCVNGITRTVEAYRNPDDDSLKRWDKNNWYSRSILIVDAAGVISGIASIGSAASNLRKMLALRGALPAEEILSSMSNSQRLQAYKEALKRISTNPALQAEFDNLLAELSPRIANRLRRGSEVIIRRSVGSVSKAISEYTAKALMQSTKEILINSMGIASSATPQEYVGSASGSVNWSANKIGNLIINVGSQ